MKKIGKEVLFLKTKQGNPRNGEGAFIRLKNGTIMYAFSESLGDDRDDHFPSNIAAVFYDDNGKTWTTPAPNNFFTSPLSPMQVKKVGKYTVMVFNPISV